MANLFRDPVAVTFIDPDNREIATIWDNTFVPRAGENVRIAGTPYVVERVGYDVPRDKVERIWIVLRAA